MVRLISDFYLSPEVMSYVTRREAAKFYGVRGPTVVDWANRNKIKSIKQPSGQRRYWIDDEQDDSGGKQEEKRRICYCRVSSAGQKEDLQRQIEYMQSKYPGYEIVSDVASGLNFERKGLKAILRSAMQGNVETIVVAHKDRLARFGYPILEFILQERNVKLLCEFDNQHRSKEEELVADILSIITVFSSRVYGARKYKKNNKGQKSQVIPESVAEETI